MIRSTPYNLGRIHKQGRNDALKNQPNEYRGWTWKQAAEYWAGWYSVKARNGSVPAADYQRSNLDLY